MRSGSAEYVTSDQILYDYVIGEQFVLIMWHLFGLCMIISNYDVDDYWTSNQVLDNEVASDHMA